MNKSIRDKKEYERGWNSIIEKLNCGHSKKYIMDNIFPIEGNPAFISGCIKSMMHNLYTKIYYQTSNNNQNCLIKCPFFDKILVGSIACANCQYFVWANTVNINHNNEQKYVICKHK